MRLSGMCLVGIAILALTGCGAGKSDADADNFIAAVERVDARAGDEQFVLQMIEAAKSGKTCLQDPKSTWSCGELVAIFYAKLAGGRFDKGQEDKALEAIETSLAYSDGVHASNGAYSYVSYALDKLENHPPQNLSRARAAYDRTLAGLSREGKNTNAGWAVGAARFVDQPRFIAVLLPQVKKYPFSQKRYSSLIELLKSKNRTQEAAGVERTRVVVLDLFGENPALATMDAQTLAQISAALRARGFTELADSTTQYAETRERLQQQYAEDERRQREEENQTEEEQSTPTFSLPVPGYAARPPARTPSYGSSTSTGTTTSPGRPVRSEAVPFHH